MVGEAKQLPISNNARKPLWCSTAKLHLSSLKFTWHFPNMSTNLEDFSKRGWFRSRIHTTILNQQPMSQICLSLSGSWSITTLLECNGFKFKEANIFSEEKHKRCPPVSSNLMLLPSQTLSQYRSNKIQILRLSELCHSILNARQKKANSQHQTKTQSFKLQTLSKFTENLNLLSGMFSLLRAVLKLWELKFTVMKQNKNFLLLGETLFKKLIPILSQDTTLKILIFLTW